MALQVETQTRNCVAAAKTSEGRESMDTQETSATLRDVGFRYPGHSVDLLRDVTLEIRPGEIVMLAGPNGSGKSTILGLLSGRLVPGVGHVRVFGKDPSRATRAPDLGLITEPFHPEQSPLPVDFTVREIVTWLEVLDGVSSDDAGPLLDQLGLGPSLIGRRVDTLSKGERQRVVLLVVLLRRPRLILADEPLEGLDRTTRHLIGECLHRYAKEGGRSIIWVSHFLSETVQYADRVIEIEGHRMVEQPTDRFAFRVSMSAGHSEEVWACSLAALPAVVAKHLVGNGTVRLEITEKRAGEKRL